MKINNEDRNALTNYRLLQAKETILDVQLLIENNRILAAVNRIYYGMFYSLLALANQYNFEKEVVEKMFLDMKEFISMIESHLSKK